MTPFSPAPRKNKHEVLYMLNMWGTLLGTKCTEDRLCNQCWNRACLARVVSRAVSQYWKAGSMKQNMSVYGLGTFENFYSMRLREHERSHQLTLPGCAPSAVPFPGPSSVHWKVCGRSLDLASILRMILKVRFVNQRSKCIPFVFVLALLCSRNIYGSY